MYSDSLKVLQEIRLVPLTRVFVMFNRLTVAVLSWQKIFLIEGGGIGRTLLLPAVFQDRILLCH